MIIITYKNYIITFYIRNMENQELTIEISEEECIDILEEIYLAREITTRDMMIKGIIYNDCSVAKVRKNLGFIDSYIADKIDEIYHIETPDSIKMFGTLGLYAWSIYKQQKVNTIVIGFLQRCLAE